MRRFTQLCILFITTTFSLGGCSQTRCIKTIEITPEATVYGGAIYGAKGLLKFEFEECLSPDELASLERVKARLEKKHGELLDGTISEEQFNLAVRGTQDAIRVLMIKKATGTVPQQYSGSGDPLKRLDEISAQLDSISGSGSTNKR